ncbi:hypothetical protein ACLB2K_030996 [Fragaria x ananassa]
MLRACTLQFMGSWDKNLSLMEFTYNNSFYSSIGMAPFETLYGKQCRTPLCWNEVRERELCGPKIIHDTNEKIKVDKDVIKAAQSTKKSYADVRRKDLEFQVGEWVFLKLSPWKGVVRFGKRRKLSPRYIGPYEIIERVGPLAYRLVLPQELSRIHNVFHVCFASILPILLMCLKSSRLVCRRICPMKRSQFKFLTERNKCLGTSQSCWSKCFGEATKYRKLLGNQRSE